MSLAQPIAKPIGSAFFIDFLIFNFILTANFTEKGIIGACKAKR